MSYYHLLHQDPLGEPAAFCGARYRVGDGYDYDGYRHSGTDQAPRFLTAKPAAVTCLGCLTKMTGIRHYRFVVTHEERALIVARRSALDREAS